MSQLYASCPRSQPARMRCGKVQWFITNFIITHVATRANALWQRATWSASALLALRRNPHECAVAKDALQLQLCGRCSRNPRECAVAKTGANLYCANFARRNPRECAVAKVQDAKNTSHVVRRNPHECAVAKSRHCCARTGNSESMNYVLHF